jgi:hypothetical protein
MAAPAAVAVRQTPALLGRVALEILRRLAHHKAAMAVMAFQAQITAQVGVAAHPLSAAMEPQAPVEMAAMGLHHLFPARQLLTLAAVAVAHGETRRLEQLPAAQAAQAAAEMAVD